MNLYPCALALLLVLTACGFTETGAALRDAVTVKAAEAYDEGLANAELFICRAASVGSVQRRYGRSRDLAEAWRALCFGDPEAGLLIGPASDRTAGP